MSYGLERGDKGQEVRRLQNRLNDTGAKLVVDGDFGPATQSAVSAYQKSSGMSVTGVGSPDVLTSLYMPVIGGLDLSHHNGKIEWDPDKNLPQFVYLKATEGRTHTDTRFVENGGLCGQLGIHYGFYHFARPDTDAGMEDAKREAQFFASTIGTDATLRPVLDLEKGMKTDDQYNVDWALTFREEITKLTGQDPILYTGKWYYDAYMRDASESSLKEIATMDLWLASYNTGAEPVRKIPIWNEWLIWQWTGSGSAPGIQGKVDQNWVAGGCFDRLLA